MFSNWVLSPELSLVNVFIGCSSITTQLNCLWFLLCDVRDHDYFVCRKYAFFLVCFVLCVVVVVLRC